MPNHVDPVQQTLERLLDALGEDEARRVLRDTGRAGAQFALERLIATRLAIRLLNDGESRKVVGDRLKARGINQRTAYRRINAALDARRDPARRIANEPPALAIPSSNIPADSSLENLMLASLAQLQTELATLKSKLEKVGLPAARANAAKARQAIEDLEADRSQKALTSQSDPVRTTVIASFDHELQKLLQAHTGARRQLVDAESRARDILREIEHLERMLSGEDRVARSSALLESVKKMAGDAAAQVKEAESAVAEITRRIEAEVRAYESARKGAAAAFLALIKSKSDTSQVPAATREKVATMELAKAEAQGELDAARAALQAAQERVNAATRDLRLAEADVTELAHEFALAAYAQTLARHQAAYWRAHRTNFHPRPALDLAQELLAGAETA